MISLCGEQHMPVPRVSRLIEGQATAARLSLVVEARHGLVDKALKERKVDCRKANPAKHHRPVG